MNNSNYDSLTQKLIQNGIIKSENFESEKNIQNPFDLDDSFENESEIEIPAEFQKTRKRLNKSDFEMVSENNLESANNSSFEIIKRFINIKQNLVSKGALGGLENFFFAFFPKLYKAQLAKDAMTRLKELNIDTNKLLDKTIPYGEGEIRYQNLIKYISFANKIQTKINEKTN